MEGSKEFLKRFLKFTFKGVLITVGIIALYLFSAYLFGKIAVEGAQSNDERDYSIYLLNTGVHTDIVMPKENDLINWTEAFPISNTNAADTSAQLIAIGWGDKGFYLETPSWADLKFSTAFEAAFWLSSSALHTTYYNELPKSMEKVELKVSEKQYKLLITYIKRSVKFSGKKAQFIETDANYGDYDAFYEGRGTYSLFFTCNTWVNEALKSSHQRSCVWTPFAGAIFEKFRK